jgi:tetratricopeptide (TPR) repeat protein
MKNLTLLLSFVLCAFSYGQNCSPNFLEASIKRAQKGRLEIKTSIEELKRLTKDFKKIDQAFQKQSQPKNYLLNCQQKKEQAFFLVVRNIRPAAHDQAKFNSTMGDFYFYKKIYDKALSYYDKAAAVQKNNFYDLQKAWKAYHHNWNLDFSKMEDIFEALPSKQLFVQEAIKRLSQLIEHPQSDLKSKISFLMARAFIFKNEKMMEKERTDWKKLIDLDPNHYIALRELAESFYQLHMYKEAKEIYKELVLHPESQELHHINNLNTLVELEDKSNLLKHSKNSQKKFSNNPIFKAYQSRALFMQNRLKEAERINSSILKKLPNNNLVNQNKALILEKKADLWMHEKIKFAHALSAYQKALELFPRRSLKEKMARVLFEYRKKLDFKPFKATKVDLVQALDLLEYQIKESNISEQTLTLYISAALKSREFNRGESACFKYFEIYTSGQSATLVKSCLEIHRETGNFTAVSKLNKLIHKKAPTKKRTLSSDNIN